MEPLTQEGGVDRERNRQVRVEAEEFGGVGLRVGAKRALVQPTFPHPDRIPILLWPFLCPNALNMFLILQQQASTAVLSLMLCT